MSENVRISERQSVSRPWDGLHRDRMPGYWLLASLGKRVLRPGGIELTKKMLAELEISSRDHVIEYAPGMGITAKLTLQNNPSSYTAIERDRSAAQMLNGFLDNNPHWRCLNADAADPVFLPDGFASVIYGESMLTIHSEEKKKTILQEVYRLLREKGRYAFQELAITTDGLDPAFSDQMRRELIHAVRHPAWPKSVNQWKQLLESEGFTVLKMIKRPVLLLEKERLIEDEGKLAALDFVCNILEDETAISRIREIRTVFRKYSKYLCGFCAICKKI